MKGAASYGNQEQGFTHRLHLLTDTEGNTETAGIPVRYIREEEIRCLRLKKE